MGVGFSLAKEGFDRLGKDPDGWNLPTLRSLVYSLRGQGCKEAGLMGNSLHWTYQKSSLVCLVCWAHQLPRGRTILKGLGPISKGKEKDICLWGRGHIFARLECWHLAGHFFFKDLM